MKKLLALAGILLALVAPAKAAKVATIATGNIGTAATWGSVATANTTFSNTEAVSAAVTTGNLDSATFTPANTALNSFAVKLSSRPGSSGTVTFILRNNTTSTNICTVTLNITDLPTAGDTYNTVQNGGTAGGLEGGWVPIACSTTPNGTDTYLIRLTASANGLVKFWAASGNNWDRMLVTTTTGAPAAGDQMYMQGKWTAAGAQTTYAITMNATALVNYGNVANTTIDPSISISKGASFAFAVTASTNFVFEHAGPMVIYNGGSYTIGTSGTPIPSTSTAVHTLNATVEENAGIEVRNGGTFNAVGVSGGRAQGKALLTVTATKNVTTTLTTNISTGWLNGDSLVMAGSKVSDGTGGYDTSAGWDTVTMNGNASGTSVPLSAAPSRWDHVAQTLDYTSSQTGVHYHLDMFPAVINITRNVTVQGSGATTGGYIYAQQAAIFYADWARFDQLTGVNAMRRGLELDIGGNVTTGTNTGSLNLTHAAVTNARRSALMLGVGNTLWGGVAGTYAKIQHIAMYNTASDNGCATTYQGLYIGPSSNPYELIDDFTIIRSAYACGYAIRMNTQNGQFTDITINSSGSCGNGCGVAVFMNGNYGGRSQGGGQVNNAWGPLYFYGNNGIPLYNANAACLWNFKIAGFYMWHEVSWTHLPPSVCGDVTIDPLYMISVAAGWFAGSGNTTVRNGVMGYDYNFGAGYMIPIEEDGNYIKATLENMEVCPPAGALGGVTFIACNPPFSLINDVDGCCDIPSQQQIYLRNSSLPGISSSTNFPIAIVANQESWLGDEAFIAFDCNGCVTKHGMLVAGGLLTYDTAITHSTGYSMRLTPHVVTFSGYISGNVLNNTSGSNRIGNQLTSNAVALGSSFDPATTPIAGAGPPYTIYPAQTTCSVGSPCQFQSYRQSGNTGLSGVLRLSSAPRRLGTRINVKSGQIANVCVWVRPSISTDGAAPWGAAAVTYNGDQPRLINRFNAYMGVTADTVLATATASAGAWQQLCANLPSAPADGAFEVVVDADQTFTSNAGGSVNIAEWTCTNCGGSNGQFWLNGAPTDVAAPPSTGGNRGGGGFGRMGGWLLWRDLEPAANDNTPAWLEKAA